MLFPERIKVVTRDEYRTTVLEPGVAGYVLDAEPADSPWTGRTNLTADDFTVSDVRDFIISYQEPSGHNHIRSARLLNQIRFGRSRMTAADCDAAVEKGWSIVTSYQYRPVLMEGSIIRGDGREHTVYQMRLALNTVMALTDALDPDRNLRDWGILPSTEMERQAAAGRAASALQGLEGQRRLYSSAFHLHNMNGPEFRLEFSFLTVASRHPHLCSLALTPSGLVANPELSSILHLIVLYWPSFCKYADDMRSHVWIGNYLIGLR